MPNVALISNLTYRTIEKQKDAFPGMPYFTIEEIPTMLRPSHRADRLNVHVLSLACVANTEQGLFDFLKLMATRKAILYSKEENVLGATTRKRMLELWREARRNGAAKAGGDARSVKALLEFWECFSKISDRWHGAEKSTDLLKVAGIKHHDTVRANLGHTRWEWRRFSDAKRERILKQIEKEVRQCQTKQ